MEAGRGNRRWVEEDEEEQGEGGVMSGVSAPRLHLRCAAHVRSSVVILPSSMSSSVQRLGEPGERGGVGGSEPEREV